MAQQHAAEHTMLGLTYGAVAGQALLFSKSERDSLCCFFKQNTPPTGPETQGRGGRWWGHIRPHMTSLRHVSTSVQGPHPHRLALRSPSNTSGRRNKFPPQPPRPLSTLESLGFPRAQLQAHFPCCTITLDEFIHPQGLFSISGQP